jgi:Cys-tRNA(Pro)/Cys-tRNA(Cys) deacylase
MAKGTPATVAQAKPASHSSCTNTTTIRTRRIGMQAAEARRDRSAQLLKTLMAKAGGAVACVVPIRQRSEPEEARGRGRHKDATMLPPAEAERITGSPLGRFLPFGQKKRVRVFVTQSALAHAGIIVNTAVGADADRACASRPGAAAAGNRC